MFKFIERLDKYFWNESYRNLMKTTRHIKDIKLCLWSIVVFQIFNGYRFVNNHIRIRNLNSYCQLLYWRGKLIHNIHIYHVNVRKVIWKSHIVLTNHEHASYELTHHYWCNPVTIFNNITLKWTQHKLWQTTINIDVEVTLKKYRRKPKIFRLHKTSIEYVYKYKKSFLIDSF